MKKKSDTELNVISDMLHDSKIGVCKTATNYLFVNEV